MIKSISTSQDEILANVLLLNGLERFEADITYGNGRFYKNILEPIFKTDLDPQTPDTRKFPSDSLPNGDGSLGSIVFDPPFLTYIKQGRKHGSIMSKTYGGYWTYAELTEHYTKTLTEARRVLRKGGILVFKCQDIIHNHKMHSTHINVVKWAEERGFRLKDLFILYKNNRLPMPDKPGQVKRQQQHARIHHSYFLVFEAL
jgi:tRNA G10  N-methylase Trm11